MSVGLSLVEEGIFTKTRWSHTVCYLTSELGVRSRKYKNVVNKC